jgi:tetratricopeptide (TPR) repeat protein
MELRDRIHAEANLAVKLDPGLADGYSALIRLARDIDYDWVSAQRYCADASVFSSNPGLMTNCAILDMVQGRYREAEEHLKSTLRVDPLWPGGGEARANLLAWAGRLEEAESQIRAVRSANPDYVPALYSLGRVLALQGRYQEALDLFDVRSNRGQALSPAQLAMMAYLCARLGQQTRAMRIENQLAGRSRVERVLLSDLALVRMGMDDHEGAVSLLEQALLNREPSLGETITDPLFQPLRDKPVFRSLRRRLNL